LSVNSAKMVACAAATRASLVMGLISPLKKYRQYKIAGQG
jgi:hypothetical protein